MKLSCFDSSVLNRIFFRGLELLLLLFCFSLLWFLSFLGGISLFEFGFSYLVKTLFLSFLSGLEASNSSFGTLSSGGLLNSFLSSIDSLGG